MKRPLILWLATGSILTWWTGTEFGRQAVWRIDRVEVVVPFALAIAPALFVEGLVRLWNALPRIA